MINRVNFNGIYITERQYEIIQNMATGMTNQEIADKLFLAKDSVDNHIQKIYRKLKIKGRSSDRKLIAEYYKHFYNDPNMRIQLNINKLKDISLDMIKIIDTLERENR